jgi:hypothetical protein
MTPQLAPPCASQLETAVNLTDRRLLSFPFAGDLLPASDPAAALSNLPQCCRLLLSIRHVALPRYVVERGAVVGLHRSFPIPSTVSMPERRCVSHPHSRSGDRDNASPE